MRDIVIVNTGSSNISSLKLAINRLGYNVLVSDNLKKIRNSKKLFLPGIGNAHRVMNFIKKKKLEKTIVNYKNPVLGICLGMQLFGKYSEEGKGGSVTSTLNIMNSSSMFIKSYGLPVPHIGWNSIVHNNNVLFRNVPQGERFYFVHSYVIPINKSTISKTFYGQFFSSAIKVQNFFGVQFHPEKSGFYGSILLKNFLLV
ncbi:imidazole glycerol phosphate synthase subunit HisH [Buchnera aphidicola]|uniref:imidazole glycerol phosphate synthase subunit HisH n=1 Tax=Buchnera aphidicola TaxID=9 RepID=UPI003D18D296